MEVKPKSVKRIRRRFSLDELRKRPSIRRESPNGRLSDRKNQLK